MRALPPHRRSQAPSTLRQADQARSDFAAILDELEFVKGQLAQLPTRREGAWIALKAVIGSLALMAAGALLLVR